MSALLDLHPDGTHPVLSGVAEVHAMLDRMHAGAAQPLVRVSTPGWSPSSTEPRDASRR